LGSCQINEQKQIVPSSSSSAPDARTPVAPLSDRIDAEMSRDDVIAILPAVQIPAVDAVNEYKVSFLGGLMAIFIVDFT